RGKRRGGHGPIRWEPGDRVVRDSIVTRTSERVQLFSPGTLSSAGESAHPGRQRRRAGGSPAGAGGGQTGARAPRRAAGVGGGGPIGWEAGGGVVRDSIVTRTSERVQLFSPGTLSSAGESAHPGRQRRRAGGSPAGRGDDEPVMSEPQRYVGLEVGGTTIKAG